MHQHVHRSRDLHFLRWPRPSATTPAIRVGRAQKTPPRPVIQHAVRQPRDRMLDLSVAHPRTGGELGVRCVPGSTAQGSTPRHQVMVTHRGCPCLGRPRRGSSGWLANSSYRPCGVNPPTDLPPQPQPRPLDPDRNQCEKPTRSAADCRSQSTLRVPHPRPVDPGPPPGLAHSGGLPDTDLVPPSPTPPVITR